IASPASLGRGEPDELDDLHAECVEAREQPVQRGLVGHDAAQLRLGDRARLAQRVEGRDDLRAQPPLHPERAFEAHPCLLDPNRRDPTREDQMVADTGVRRARPPRMRNGLDEPGGGSGAAGSSVPVAHHVVPRPRLFALLEAGARGPAMLVAATAGWGKSVLLTSWIAAGAGGRAPVWLRLARDDDAAGFWAAVARALTPVLGPEGGAVLRPLATGGHPVEDPPGMVSCALRRAATPVLLVLDDLHVLTSPEVHAGLVGLVERSPPQLSLVVLTRRDPPWPLSRLRLAGLLAEVRAQDLAFGLDEAAKLFRMLSADLDDSQVRRLVERTEGWPAG